MYDPRDNEYDVIDARLTDQLVSIGWDREHAVREVRAARSGNESAQLGIADALDG